MTRLLAAISAAVFVLTVLRFAVDRLRSALSVARLEDLGSVVHAGADEHAVEWRGQSGDQLRELDRIIAAAAARRVE